MRRPAHYLFAFCRAASLVLCVAVAAFWAGSYGTTLYVSGVRPPRSVHVLSSDGVVRLVLGDSTGETWPAELVQPPGWSVEAWPTPGRSDGSVWEELPDGLPGRMGFDVQGDTVVNAATSSGGTVTYRTGDRLYLPHWSLVAAFAVLPGVAMRRALRRRRRLLRGLCPACGYDLRASPGRCPECGAKSGGLRTSG